MKNYEELKRLAGAAPSGPWIAENDSLYFKDHGYTRHLLDADEGHDVSEEAYYAALKFIAAAHPAALLALIAERDQLKAENEALRKDKDRLDALEANFWDVRHSSSAMADSGDYNTSVEIVGHWMEKPCERVIGEDYNENLRAAIDQAMKAPAYPPARPEYEFEIPDFGGGNGNKARRKANALGIDYDAAMCKGEQS